MSSAELPRAVGVWVWAPHRTPWEITRQRRICTQHARTLGWHVTRFYCDAGHNLLDPLLPGITRLLVDLERGAITAVIIETRLRLPEDPYLFAAFSRAVQAPNKLEFVQNVARH